MTQKLREYKNEWISRNSKLLVWMKRTHGSRVAVVLGRVSAS